MFTGLPDLMSAIAIVCHYVSESGGMYFSRAIRAITPYPHIAYWISTSVKNMLFVQCAYNKVR